MLAPLREQLQELLLYKGVTLKEKHRRSYYLQKMVIYDNLKRQIKKRTLYTCRLLLLNQIFQNISNCSKVFEDLPTLFLQYT